VCGVQASGFAAGASRVWPTPGHTLRAGRSEPGHLLCRLSVDEDDDDVDHEEDVDEVEAEGEDEVEGEVDEDDAEEHVADGRPLGQYPICCPLPLNGQQVRPTGRLTGRPNGRPIAQRTEGARPSPAAASLEA